MNTYKPSSNIVHVRSKLTVKCSAERHGLSIYIDLLAIVQSVQPRRKPVDRLWTLLTSDLVSEDQDT
jgi:hypothetical protein